MPMPNESLQKHAQLYVTHALDWPKTVLHPPLKVNIDTATRIAAAYEALPVLDTSVDTLTSYAALEHEINLQWDYLRYEYGLLMEPWGREGQPYVNSAMMRLDVSKYMHLWFFTGGEVHPLLGKIGDDGLSANDKLRAVHDVFGHAAGGFEFGPNGEESAWFAHSRMFSPRALPAITTETRGQNSWVNYGPYSHLPVKERPYAVQKAALLPKEFWYRKFNPFLVESYQ